MGRSEGVCVVHLAPDVESLAAGGPYKILIVVGKLLVVWDKKQHIPEYEGFIRGGWWRERSSTVLFYRPVERIGENVDPYIALNSIGRGRAAILNLSFCDKV